MPGCLFQDVWLTDDYYRKWLIRGSDVKCAKCFLCKKEISVENMGEAALKSHMAGVKHSRRLDVQEKLEATATKITGFWKNATVQKKSNAGDVAAVPVDKEKTTPQQKSFVTTSETLSSEILWALKVVTSHYSFKSSHDTKHLFRKMFPDSAVAANFSCGERKCNYLCAYGIAPYFKRLLSNEVKKADCYVLMFDESHNHKTQTKQMDFHVRVWRSDEVVTRYYGSEFLGHATAEDMHKKFEDSTVGLDGKKLVQLSMDGPNVNWKLHEIVENDMQKNLNCSLINIGSCGLHVVHGAFKDGADATGWHVDSFLKSIHTLLKDTPARREDYAKVTDSSTFPLKFCKHRWVENVPVIERAIKIFPDMKKFVKAVDSKQIPNPKTKSFETIKEWCGDHLALAKMQFYNSVAKQVTPFLTAYQTDKPMMPFLCADLQKVVRAVLERFVKQDALSGVTTMLALTRFDPEDHSLQTHFKKIDVGFTAKNSLSALLSAKKISERQEMQFRMECKDFLVKVVKKLLSKTPLQYAIARNMAFLDPRNMAAKKDTCVTMLTRLLRYLVDARRVCEEDCDETVRQLKLFIDEEAVSSPSTFSAFKPYTDRVDTLLHTTMSKNQAYEKLWAVVKVLLLLSHGQATVERGFSINRQVEVQNLKEQSYVALRTICDHVHSVGGVLNVKLDKSLLLSAAGARQMYQTYLDEKKRETTVQEGLNKRKLITDEIEVLKKKKKDIQNDIEALKSSADTFADKAETTRNFTFVSKSNSMRRSAKEKEVSFHQLDAELNAKLEELKAM